jgi:Sulfotransferase family
LLSRFPDIGFVNEPLIGLHLGVVFDQVIAAPPKAGPAAGGRIYDLINLVGEDDYFFNDNHRHVWEPALRNLLLARFQEQMQQRGLQPGRSRMLLKEPHGSEGTDLLSSALPQSRMLLLVRDGRDVLDSELDSIAPGAWSSYAISTEALDADERNQLIEAQAMRWVLRSRVSQQAFGRHDESLRLMLRYEDLLADTETHVARIVDWLGLPRPANLSEVVAATQFSALPADRTGPGQFARAASPGLWRERFTAEEQAMLAKIMGEQLAILGYDV